MELSVDANGEVTGPPLVSPILQACYDNEEQQIYRDNLGDSPHGEKWHTSFHASSFPGFSDKACARKALYTMCNFPGSGPVDRSGRAVMEAGKSIEDQIVQRFYRAGILLSAPPDAEHQTNLQNWEAWLSGSPDAVIKTPNKKAHAVEIKTKDHERVEEMRLGIRGYDEPHKVQLFTYMWLVKEAKLGWPPLTGGSLLYVSRNRPDFTVEYNFDVPSKDFYDTGIEALINWKEDFTQDQLPARNPDWKWTEMPCKYCAFKKHICKPDHKEGVVQLSRSNGIKFAKEIRGNYDFSSVISDVIKRWES